MAEAEDNPGGARWLVGCDYSKACRAFFHTIEQHAPQVLRSMRKEVFAKWIDLSAGSTDDGAGSARPIRQILETSTYRTLADPRGLIQQDEKVILVDHYDRYHPYFEVLVTLWGERNGLGPCPSPERQAVLDEFVKREPWPKAMIGNTEEEWRSCRAESDTFLYNLSTAMSSNLDPCKFRGLWTNTTFYRDCVLPVVCQTIEDCSKRPVSAATDLHWSYPSWTPTTRLAECDRRRCITTFWCPPGRRLKLKAWVLPRVYPIDVQGWDPVRESQEAGVERMTREARSQIEEYVNLQKKNLEREGWKRAKRMPKPQHFKWLVQWHISRMTYSQILGEAGSGKHDLKTIRGGIVRAARAVYGPVWKEWLRRGEPGRPRNEPS
jgi:hypothetical protein